MSIFDAILVKIKKNQKIRLLNTALLNMYIFGFGSPSRTEFYTDKRDVCTSTYVYVAIFPGLTRILWGSKSLTKYLYGS